MNESIVLQATQEVPGYEQFGWRLFTVPPNQTWRLYGAHAFCSKPRVEGFSVLYPRSSNIQVEHGAGNAEFKKSYNFAGTLVSGADDPNQSDQICVWIGSSQTDDNITMYLTIEGVGCKPTYLQ